VGKTTLARLLAQAVGAELLSISAVLGGVKEIRDAVAQSQLWQAQGRACVVFVDEVHRFNKSQQDAFLPHVESGLFVFIGATTENPSFEVNSALLSRAQVFRLEPLGSDAMNQLVSRALSLPEGQGLSLPAPAKSLLFQTADGDGRRLLNLLSMVMVAASSRPMEVDARWLSAQLPSLVRQFDKGGDAFYDQISALHKSVRGSDVNASLYWLARMLAGGEDPLYIIRRIVRMAVEDIGLADPNALVQALAAKDAFELLGSPEGELAIAQALIYVAVAPKSNAAYVAFRRAQSSAGTSGSLSPPMNILNAPTRMMKDLGYGKDYVYEPDTDLGVSTQRFFPEEMRPETYYEPRVEGLEARIRERLARWAALRTNPTCG